MLFHPSINMFLLAKIEPWTLLLSSPQTNILLCSFMSVFMYDLSWYNAAIFKRSFRINEFLNWFWTDLREFWSASPWIPNWSEGGVLWIQSCQIASELILFVYNQNWFLTHFEIRNQLKHDLWIFSFHKLIPRNTQMTTLYTYWSLYITFTMVYHIRQE